MMTNPLIHALAFMAAVVLPGGLLVYFIWKAYKVRQSKSQRPTPKEARDAFMQMFPPDSLRAQSRKKQLDRAKAYKWRNPQ